MKTKIWYIVITLAVAAIIRLIIRFVKGTKKEVIAENDKFQPVIYPSVIRNDIRGSGEYKALRISHTHEGIDLICSEGQNVYAPFSGTITRVAYPYGGDTRWTGLVLEGDNGYTMKLFYVSPVKMGKTVQSGEVIAIAQSISKKYGAGMKDHIHVEIIKDNINIDPTQFFV